MSKNTKIIIFMITTAILLTLFAFFKKDCVYNTLMDKKNSSEVKVIEKEVLNIIGIWHTEERNGFIDTSTIDIGPIIINKKGDKCYIFLIDFLKKNTMINNVHGKKIGDKWEFTTNGAISIFTSKFSNNRKENYRLSIKRIIKDFKDNGYVNSYNCEVNEKIFNRFRYFEMEDPHKYDFENL